MPPILFQIIYQTIGIMGMTCGFISFQCKNNRTYYLLQAAVGFFFSIQFLLTEGGAYAGMIINCINIIRGITFAFSKWAREKLPFSIMLIIAYLAAGTVAFLFFDEKLWLAILVMVAQVVGTIIMRTNNQRIIRNGTLSVVSPAWLVYDAFKLSIGGVLCEVFNITSVIIAMIRFRKKKEPESSEQ